MSAIERIIAERERHVELGYTSEHDDGHVNQEIADMAAGYCFGGLTLKTSDPRQPLEITCHGLTDSDIRRKPRIRQLEIAAALIIAEIERLERLNENVGTYK